MGAGKSAALFCLTLKVLGILSRRALQSAAHTNLWLVQYPALPPLHFAGQDKKSPSILISLSMGQSATYAST
jgi:hypothetical protein